MPREIEQVVKQIADIAARNSRVATGKMSDAWDSRMEGPLKGVAFSDDFKSLFHEYGTVQMSAQPMVRPAAEDAFPSLITALTKVVNGPA